MQAKEYLNQAYRLNELIESNEQEIADLNLLKDSLPGTDYSKERVQSSSASDAGFTRIVDKIDELERAIIADTERMLSLKLEIRETINAVFDNEHKLVLKYRYLNFMSWGDICDKMNVSMRTAHRIHSDALADVKVPEQNTMFS